MFEREGSVPIQNPTVAQIERELRRLRSNGPSAYATVTAHDGSYLQTAGSPAGLLLEKREDNTGRHYRAFQHTPVVPFADGTELVFSAGRIRLLAGEWFRIEQVVEVFSAFLDGRPEPADLHWRDISSLFGKREAEDDAR